MEIIQNPSLNLPKDMVYEILTWISLETLEQCRLVSKEINAFTNLSYFMNLYSQRTSTFSGYIVQTCDRDNNSVHKFISCGKSAAIDESLSLNFLPEEVSITALNNNEGLVLCVNGYQTNYYVCKPTTKEWVKMKKPKTRFVTSAVGMVVLKTQPLRYMIVRFSQSMQQDARDFSNFCELFDSATAAWKRSNNIKFKYGTFLMNGLSINYNGKLHWLTNKSEIFSFDVKEESWKLIHLPEELIIECDIYAKKLVQYEGNLAILNSKRDLVNVWVMEHYTKQIWVKKMTVENREVLDLYTSDVVVRREDRKLVVHNCTNQTRTILNVNVHPSSFIHNFVPFKSDYKCVF